MKRVLIATTAAVIAFSGAASAMTNASGNLERQVQEFLPTADISNLPEGALSQLRSIIADHGDDSVASVKGQLDATIKVYQ